MRELGLAFTFYPQIVHFLRSQQFSVHFIFRFELGVGTTLYKPSFVHHDNLMGVADGLQMVSNDQNSAVADKGRHGLLYLVLIDGIDVARYFVQKEDGSVFEERTGDGKALLLSARKPQAILSDLRFVTIRQADDEVVYHRPTCGFLDFRLRGIAITHLDVVGDGIGKEDDVLHHHTDFTEQIIIVHLPNIHAADAEASGLWFPQGERMSLA